MEAVQQYKVFLSPERTTMAAMFPNHRECEPVAVNTEFSFWVANEGLPYIHRHGGEAHGLFRLIKVEDDTALVAWRCGNLQVATAKVPVEMVKHFDQKTIEHFNTWPSSYGLC